MARVAAFLSITLPLAILHSLHWATTTPYLAPAPEVEEFGAAKMTSTLEIWGPTNPTRSVSGGISA